MAATSLMNTFATVIATLLGLAVEIGLLAIALTVVRARRPEASMPLAAGAVVHMIATLLSPLLYSLILPRLASGGSLGTVYAVLGLGFTFVRTLGWGAILFGIVKLAGAPGSGPSDPTRYA